MPPPPPQSPPLLYLSVGHTAHSTENTGIQRVTRSLARALQESSCFFEYIEWTRRHRYVVLDDTARARLARCDGPPFVATPELARRLLPAAPPPPPPPDAPPGADGAPAISTSPSEPVLAHPAPTPAAALASAPAWPPLTDAPIHAFEALYSAIAYPVWQVPGWIGRLPLPRLLRREIRKAIRRWINFRLQFHLSARIRRYTRQIIRARRAWDTLQSTRQSCLELERDARLFGLNMQALARRLEWENQRLAQQRAWEENHHAAHSRWRRQQRALRRTLSAPSPLSLVPSGAPAPSLALWPDRDTLWLAHRLRNTRFHPPRGSWVVIPEWMTADEMARALRWIHRRRLRAAVIFHDAIAVQFPELVNERIRRNHAGYMRAAARADLILPVSQFSADAFAAFARAERLPLPPLRVCPNGTDFPGLSRPSAPRCPRPGEPLRLLCVATLDPRKNHASLLAAMELLAREHPRLDWRLRLIGHSYPGHETIAAAVRAAGAADPRITWESGLSQEDLAAAYRSADLTVFPSLVEGFGLPILESLFHGAPCVCADFGVMAEAAAGGGCLPCDVRHPPALAAALHSLLTDPARLSALSAAALARPLRSWSDHARDLLSALASIHR